VILRVRLETKYPHDLLHQMSSNLNRSFQFKCRNEFYIMPWPTGIGWGNNKDNYFSRWLHGKREKIAYMIQVSDVAPGPLVLK
jgi:hypothetical protein